MALVKLDTLQEKVEETIHLGEVNLVKVRKNNSCESGEIISIAITGFAP